MNTQLQEKELHELLTPTDRPTPPEGLAQRIKADIPDLADIPMPTAAPSADNRVDRRWRRRSWMAAAASVVLVAGAAFFYARHGRDLSEPPTIETSDDKSASVLRADAPAPAAPDPSPESSADLRSLGDLADEAPVEAAVEEVVVVTSEAPVIPPGAAPAEEARSRQVVSARRLEAPADGQMANEGDGRRKAAGGARPKIYVPPTSPPPSASSTNRTIGPLEAEVD